MSKITLDSDLRAKFGSIHEPVELCDAAGQTLGRYVPEELYQKLVYQLAEAQRPALSADEIQRRRQMPGHKSLTEILQGLGKP